MVKVFGMAKEKVIFVAKEKNNGKPELFIQPTMQKMLEQKIFYRWCNIHIANHIWNISHCGYTINYYNKNSIIASVAAIVDITAITTLYNFSFFSFLLFSMIALNPPSWQNRIPSGVNRQR